MYQVEVESKKEIVAKEIIPGDSKEQLQLNNQYEYLETKVKFLGWGQLTFEPVSYDANEAKAIITSPKGKEFIFDDSSSEGMNKIEANIHNQGKDYINQHSGKIKLTLQNDLDDCFD
ncbi:hypothetical protein V6W78_06190 [Mannheimia sp. HC-2023]